MLVFIAVIGAVFAPVLAPYDPVAISAPDRLQGPSVAHPLGTDQYGRDNLSRILYGGRTSLFVAGTSILFATVIGGTLGLMAGYLRGGFDVLVMRLTDVLLSFPAILLAIALIAFYGNSILNLVLAIGIVYTGPFVRVARAAVFTVREELYVEAARALGARGRRVVLLGILPNITAPLIVEITLRLAYAVLTEASLSFLGLGPPPPTPSWGQMIAEGQRFLALSPWSAVAPGLVIMLTVLGFNLLGDGIRDLTDPRLTE
jgi:peptide/nickel transport system permease protein